MVVEKKGELDPARHRAGDRGDRGGPAILGTALPWVQTIGRLNEVDAFGLSVRVLSGWDDALKGGFELGLLIVILAGVGVVVSMISGGGIVRRILGFPLIMICAVYVLQTQDLLTTSNRGLGTGLNVWDIVDYGVLVTFGGGVPHALRSEPLTRLS